MDVMFSLTLIGSNTLKHCHLKSFLLSYNRPTGKQKDKT